MISTVVTAVGTSSVVVFYGGREFVATHSMADAFFGRAQRVVEAGATELVPLLHSGGVDLLLISREIPFGVAEGVRAVPLKHSA